MPGDRTSRSLCAKGKNIAVGSCMLERAAQQESAPDQRTKLTVGVSARLSYWIRSAEFTSAPLSPPLDPNSEEYIGIGLLVATDAHENFTSLKQLL